MNFNNKIFVAGANGLVGSSLTKYLKNQGYRNLLTPSSKELDLTSEIQTSNFFRKHQPDYVFLCAAKVGGIKANSQFPAEFIRQNLTIQTNTIHQAKEYNVTKLLFLGSSCIYPKLCKQPIKEEYLLSSKLEPTNKPYAIAKIAGITMCQAYNKQYGCNFISAMPTNLYGPRDNFDLNNSHVLPALIRKFHNALPDKDVILWGTGKPKREFLHVNDLSSACLKLMLDYDDPELINIGFGSDISIKDLAELIQKIIGHKGQIKWDDSKPDGTPRKLLETSKINSLGWSPSISLEEGIKLTYDWYKLNGTPSRSSGLK